MKLSFIVRRFIMIDKSILRNQILKKRTELPYPLWKEKSEKIFHFVINHPLFKSTPIIYIYIDWFSS